MFWLFRKLLETHDQGAAIFAKTRYRGLAKNANRAFAMLAMTNLVK